MEMLLIFEIYSFTRIAEYDIVINKLRKTTIKIDQSSNFDGD